MNICYLASDPRMKVTAPTGYGSHIRKTIKVFNNSGIKVVPIVAGDVKNVEPVKNAFRKVGGTGLIGLGSAKVLVRDVYEILDDNHCFWRYKEILKKEPVNFIYERNTPFRTVGLRLARYFGIPLILEVNDPFRETFKYYHSVLGAYAVRLQERQIRKAAGVIVGSQMLKKFYVEKGVDETRIKVIYPTADYDLFQPEDKSGSKITNNEIKLGFIGNMRLWHRVDILLRAFKEVLEARRDVGLVLIGEGPEMEKLRLSAKELGIDSRVDFKGSIPYEAVPNSMKDFDICVIPYATWYGSPTKLFEYGAMGKAVVGPTETPVKEIITDKIDGKLVPLGNVRELENALLELCRDSSQRERYGRNLRKKLIRDISWEKNISQIVGMLDGK